MNNSKKSWTGFNTILYRKRKQKDSDIFLDYDGKLITDQKRLSKLFNNYFVNVVDNLARQIPKPNTKFQDYPKNPNGYSIWDKTVINFDGVVILSFSFSLGNGEGFSVPVLVSSDEMLESILTMLSVTWW